MFVFLLFYLPRTREGLTWRFFFSVRFEFLFFSPPPTLSREGENSLGKINTASVSIGRREIFFYIWTNDITWSNIITTPSHYHRSRRKLFFFLFLYNTFLEVSKPLVSYTRESLSESLEFPNATGACYILDNTTIFWSHRIVLEWSHYVFRGL